MNATLTANNLNELAATLGTTNKNVVISATISALVAGGFTVREAFDTVMGPGGYEKLAGEVYDQLRA